MFQKRWLKMKNLLALFLVAAFAASLLTYNALAEDRLWPKRDARENHREHRGTPQRLVDWRHDRHWYGDIHRFQKHDLNYWRAGHWWRGRHTDRLGWYWVVGDTYYYYPAPHYPYPDPYIPASTVPDRSGRNWYYCASPQGYYPYVPVCRTGWEAVPATVD